MKKSVLIPVSLALCASVIVCGGAAVYAGGAFDESSSEAINTVAEKAASVVDASGADNAGAFKDETVYVIADADGSVRKVIVSDWLKNPMGEAVISDKTFLTEIENVKSDASFTMDGGSCVWDANGGDIYCQGQTDAELPVAVNISFTLDGKSVKADDLAGKSGHLVMNVSYINRQYETVSIDGKDEKIAVPYVMLTGMLLDNDVFSNVTLTNGRMLGDGDRLAVVGISLPGLADNLGIDRDTIEIPDSVTVEADVKNFSMMNTITVATSGVFDEIDLSSAETTVEDLKNKLGTLRSGMNALLEGSDSLCSGLTTLLEKSGVLASGITELAVGAGELRDGAELLDNKVVELVSGTEQASMGASQLDEGINKLENGETELASGASELRYGTEQAAGGVQSLADGAAELANGSAELVSGAEQVNGGAAALDNGISELKNGLEKLTENNEKLAGGADAIFATLLSEADAKLASSGIEAPALTKDNYSSVIDGIIAKLEQSVEQGEAALEIYKDSPEMTAQLTAQINGAKGAVASLGELKAGLTSYAEFSEGLSQYLDGVASAAEGASDLEQGGTELCKGTVSLLNGAKKTQGGADQLSSGSAELCEGTSQLLSGCDKLGVGIGTLRTGTEALSDGASELASGTKIIASGAAALKEGTASLAAGAERLYNGIITLKNGVPTLVSGVSALEDGGNQLRDGLRELDSDGISKLTGLADGELHSVLVRLRATVDVAKDNKSFTGISDGMEGKVKYIYRTDSIESGK